MRQSVFDAVVDAFGFGPGVSVVAGPGAGLAATLLGWRLFERCQRTRGGVRRAFGGHETGQFEDLQPDDDGVLLGERLSLSLGECAGAKGVEELGVEFGNGRLGGVGCHAYVIAIRKKRARPVQRGEGLLCLYLLLESFCHTRL